MIFALATAAHSQARSSVELFDAELAELQNCSVKTVQRQRDDYQSEARRLRTVDLVGVEEGEYDRDNNRHAPTRYTLHLTGTIEAVVAHARSDPRWRDLDRKGQRELLKQAAARAYDLIPDATRKPRKRKRPRLASAVVETLATKSRQGRYYKPVTVRLYLVLLSRVFEAAIDEGLLTVNPCRKVRWKRGETLSRRERVLSPDEEVRLFAQLEGSPETRDAAELALNTGLRKMTILRMNVAQFDRAGRSFKFTGKGGREHVLPLNSAAWAIVERRMADSAPGGFSSAAGRGTTCRTARAPSSSRRRGPASPI